METCALRIRVLSYSRACWAMGSLAASWLCQLAVPADETAHGGMTSKSVTILCKINAFERALLKKAVHCQFYWEPTSSQNHCEIMKLLAISITLACRVEFRGYVFSYIKFNNDFSHRTSYSQTCLLSVEVVLSIECRTGNTAMVNGLFVCVCYLTFTTC